MKSAEQIKVARNALCEKLNTPGLNPSQSALFCGMLNALAWVCDSPNGSTLDRLIAGEPIAAGKDPSHAHDRLEKIANTVFNCPTCGGPMAHSRLHGMFCPTCRT